MSSNSKSYLFVNSYLSGGQKYKIYLLIFLFLVFPFFRFFTNYYHLVQVNDPLLPWSIFNFVALMGCATALLLHRKEYSERVLMSFAVVLIIVIVNYFFAEMAQFKSAMNWIGFLIMFVVIAQVIKSFSEPEMVMLQVRSMQVMKILLIVLTILTIYALLIDPWYLNPSLFQYYVLEDRNQIHRLYSNNIGGNKQHYAILATILITFIITHWKYISKGIKIVFVIFIFFNIPAIFGVRTMILGAFVTFAAFFFLKNRIRLFFANLIVLIIVLLVIQYWNELYLIFEVMYDRLPALRVSLDAMTQNVFGLGNGAYTIYVLENNDMLLRTFGSDLMERHGHFWRAPESDIVYFIASFGIFSIVFFAFLGYLIVKGIHLVYHNNSLFPVERALVIHTVIMIFYGISSDYAGKLTWWIFISILFGIVLRNCYQPGNNENKISVK